MQLYIEQLKVYGKQTLQSFIGPFESEDTRQKFCHVLRARMQKSRQDITQHMLDHPEHFSKDEAEKALLLASDDNTKFLMHDGHLPPGQYLRIEDKKYRGIFYWFTKDEADKADKFGYK